MEEENIYIYVTALRGNLNKADLPKKKKKVARNKKGETSTACGPVCTLELDYFFPQPTREGSRYFGEGKKRRVKGVYGRVALKGVPRPQ